MTHDESKTLNVISRLSGISATMRSIAILFSSVAAAIAGALIGIVIGMALAKLIWLWAIFGVVCGGIIGFRVGQSIADLITVSIDWMQQVLSAVGALEKAVTSREGKIGQADDAQPIR